MPPGFVVEARVERWPDGFRARFAEALTPLLAAGPVAVRSSAIGEDGAAKSFAGLFETTLSLGEEAAVWDAAARCIASGGSMRALGYAGRDEPVPVGVIVQSMVPAVRAGVCFSRDPAGTPGVVIEVVDGLGDALVSGRAAPRRAAVYRNGLGRDEVVGDLDGAVLIAAEARRIEAALGDPVDLEFEIDDKRVIHWLQARPITAIAPPVRIERVCPDVDDGPVTVWSNWNVRETMPDPLAPLSWTIWRDHVLPMVTENLFGISRKSKHFAHAVGLDRLQGRIYFNMNALLSLPGIGKLVPRILRVVDATAGQLLIDLRDAGLLARRRLPGAWLSRVAGMAAASMRSNLSLLRNRDPARSWAALRAVEGAIAKRAPLRSLSDEALLAELRLLATDDAAVLKDGLQMMTVAMLVYGLADTLFRRYPDARALLAVGIPDNPTTAISIGIDELAEATAGVAAHFREESDGRRILERLRADPSAADWLSALDRFLARNGQRAPKEFDIAQPRWIDDPSMVLLLVRDVLVHGGETTRDRLLRGRAEREREVKAAIAASFLPLRPLMRWAAGAVVRHMPFREAPKHEGLRLFLRTRHAALEAGRRLVDRGLLPAADDVFLLEEEEVRRAVRGEPVAVDLAARRAEQADFAARRAPDFVRSDGVPVEEAAVPTDEPGVLLGVGVSRGRGTGPVVLLDEADPSRLRPGCVLVVEFADPGWTPLFPRCAAVVMEVGGSMCHAAVVARELSIPAVFGVRGARKKLAEGAIVSVDGARGEVRTV